MRHDSGLHHPDLSQAASTGNRIDAGVESYRMCAKAEPGYRLRRAGCRKEGEEEKGETANGINRRQRPHPVP